MRFLSLCTVLGAALLPAASARPLCRPDTTRPATTTATNAYPGPTSTETSGATEYLTTATTDYVTTTSINSDTTITESATTDVTSLADIETTTSEEPEPTNYVADGDFEEGGAEWKTRTGGIKNDAAKANSPTHYAELKLNNQQGIGGNQLNQTINGLDTRRLFRLSFSAAVFDLTVPAGAQCSIRASQDGVVFGMWPLDTSNLGHYKSYDTTFVPVDEDVVLAFDLRCSNGASVAITVGIDDVVINNIGKAPLPPAPTTTSATTVEATTSATIDPTTTTEATTTEATTTEEATTSGTVDLTTTAEATTSEATTTAETTTAEATATETAPVN